MELFPIDNPQPKAPIKEKRKAHMPYAPQETVIKTMLEHPECKLVRYKMPTRVVCYRLLTADSVPILNVKDKVVNNMWEKNYFIDLPNHSFALNVETIPSKYINDPYISAKRFLKAMNSKKVSSTAAQEEYDALYSHLEDEVLSLKK